MEMISTGPIRWPMKPKTSSLQQLRSSAWPRERDENLLPQNWKRADSRLLATHQPRISHSRATCNLLDHPWRALLRSTGTPTSHELHRETISLHQRGLPSTKAAQTPALPALVLLSDFQRHRERCDTRSTEATGMKSNDHHLFPACRRTTLVVFF